TSQEKPSTDLLLLLFKGFHSDIRKGTNQVTKLQLFEYESVSFSCQGLNVSAGWRVRNIKNRTSCLMSTVTCTNNYTLVSDSGEYWCEAAGGERSNTVNITVTGTLIVLPVVPVMEGESVSLRCRTRKNVSDLTANFYKDGLLIGNSSTGNITIESVSRSDDGLYKCNIPGAGESPQSQLMVTGKCKESLSNIPKLQITEVRIGVQTTYSFNEELKQTTLDWNNMI
uniref:Ig-like domain-containing protein n=1 Tax=Seriola dumerili TaxID=41447 RepID=A0A3B4TGU5_SERDU